LVKGEVLPYSLPSVGPRPDPGVQAVSPQVILCHPPGGRLSLLSARPAVTFLAEKHHHPSAGTKLYRLVIEAQACKQLAQGCYLEADWPRFEPATFWIVSEHSTVTPHGPHSLLIMNMYFAKMAEFIMMPFEVVGRVGPRYYVLVGSSYPHGMGQIFEVNRVAQCNRECGISLAKMAESIKMPFAQCIIF